jgi:hypothetical protein
VHIVHEAGTVDGGGLGSMERRLTRPLIRERGPSLCLKFTAGACMCTDAMYVMRSSSVGLVWCAACVVIQLEYNVSVDTTT